MCENIHTLSLKHSVTHTSIHKHLHLEKCFYHRLNPITKTWLLSSLLSPQSLLGNCLTDIKNSEDGGFGPQKCRPSMKEDFLLATKELKRKMGTTNFPVPGMVVAGIPKYPAPGQISASYHPLLGLCHHPKPRELRMHHHVPQKTTEVLFFSSFLHTNTLNLHSSTSCSPLRRRPSVPRVGGFT